MRRWARVVVADLSPATSLGMHTLRCQYIKDDGSESGYDYAWVDWVQWTGAGSPEPDPDTWAVLSYTYDPSGRRISKKYDGSTVLTYLYDGDHCIAAHRGPWRESQPTCTQNHLSPAILFRPHSSSMNLPRITIVTPSYNQAKYLPETIESVLNQGYPNLEYIIIDGGSTDGSVEIIKKYGRDLAYWVSEKDSGQSEAINKGLSRCTGDLFNWINSDDLLFPGALRRIGQAYVRHPSADMIVGNNARGDSHGRILRVSAVPSRAAMLCAPWLLWVAQQSTFLSVATLRGIGRLREDLHCMMDAELYYRILSAGGRLVRARGMVGLIREHVEAKGNVRKDGWLEERRRLFDEYQVSPFSWRSARAQMLLYRLFDGSAMRSWVLSRRLKGAVPFQTTSDS